MTTHEGSASDGSGLDGLFDASPALEVHTSAASVTAFLCGLGALLAAPFAITFSLAVVLGVLGVCASIGGVVATSRPLVAGRALAPLGLFLSVVALALVGVRYGHLDTAFGDRVLTGLRSLLERLNSELRMP